MKSLEVILKEVNTQGFSSIPGFWDEDKCKTVREEIDSFLSNAPDRIWSGKLGADKRIFGLDNISKGAKSFYEDEYVKRMFSLFEDIETREGFVMGARIDATLGNLGSGEGWHRDRTDKKQYKAILYLSDVTESSGPLEIITNSHKTWHKLYLKFFKKIDLNEARLNDERVGKVIDGLKRNTFTGKQGTLLFLNVNAIHRGAPILTGSRYAMTIYSWFGQKIPSHIQKLIIKNDY